MTKTVSETCPEMCPAAGRVPPRRTPASSAGPTYLLAWGEFKKKYIEFWASFRSLARTTCPTWSIVLLVVLEAVAVLLMERVKELEELGPVERVGGVAMQTDVIPELGAGVGSRTRSSLRDRRGNGQSSSL